MTAFLETFMAGNGNSSMELEFIYSDVSTARGDDVSVSGQVQAGDIIVFSSHEDILNNNQSTPSGFTSIYLDNDPEPAFSLAYKESNGTETTLSVPTDSYGACTVYRPSKEVSTISATTCGLTRGSPPADKTITFSDSDKAKIAIAIAGIYTSIGAPNTGLTITGTGFTQVGALEGGSVIHAHSYKMVNSGNSEPDRTISVSDSASQQEILAAAYIEVE